jgi:hypothetical protein
MHPSLGEWRVNELGRPEGFKHMSAPNTVVYKSVAQLTTAEHEAAQAGGVVRG